MFEFTVRTDTECYRLDMCKFDPLCPDRDNCVRGEGMTEHWQSSAPLPAPATEPPPPPTPPPLFVESPLRRATPLLEAPVVTLVERREDYGVFNDRTAPAFARFTDAEWDDSMLNTPLFVGTLWEARQYARHFTEQRKVAGTLDANGSLLVMLQVVTMSAWEIVPDDAE